MPIATEEAMSYEEMTSFVRTHRCGCGAYPLKVAWGGGLGLGQQWVLRCGEITHDTMTKNRPTLGDRLFTEQLRYLHGGPEPSLYDTLPDESKVAPPVEPVDHAQAQRDIKELWG